jgi:GntR family transcriptional regulator, rspAB operon transcriptional repressor
MNVPRQVEIEDALDRVQIERGQPIAPQIYAILRQRIVDNRLPPGSSLSETALSVCLNVSRTPLRAALQQLATEGLIQIWPQVGSVVAPLAADRLEEAVLMRSALEEATARRLATKGITAKAFEESLHAQERLAVRDDYAGFFREDEAFHERLAQLAGMPNAWRVVHSIKGHVDRQRFRMMSGIPMRSMRAYEDHRRIVARIVAGDAEGAALAMRAHVLSVLELTPRDTGDKDADRPMAIREDTALTDMGGKS